MKSNTNDEKGKVYEIGYVLVSSIPQEKVAAEATSLKDVLVKAGASVLAEENPELTQLAYTMVKKIHGSNQRFSEGYFGWLKFELSTEAVESVKKAFDNAENILRYLLIITVKENTYLGKRAPATAPISREMGIIAPEKGVDAVADVASVGTIDAAGEAIVVEASSSEDMDKSIDAMVKGA
jgi:ribosomal protein S6